MFHKDKKGSCGHHSFMGLTVIVLLAFIILVLIAQIILMVGLRTPNPSKHVCQKECQKEYQKSPCEHAEKKVNQTKPAFASYAIVKKLTESGFVARNSEGKEFEVTVDTNTSIIQNGDTTDKKIKANDKVYLNGYMDENNSYIAKMIKIYN